MELSYSMYDEQMSDMSFAFSSHLNYLMHQEDGSSSVGLSFDNQAEQPSHEVDSGSERRPSPRVELEHVIRNASTFEKEMAATSHNYSDSFKSDNQHEKFVWNADVQMIFARVVLHVGLVGIKPKAIYKLFPKKYGLNCQQLGSHLQKYKLRVQKDYRLSSFDDFENWMYPQHLKSDSLDKLSMKWRGQACSDSSADLTFRE